MRSNKGRNSDGHSLHHRQHGRAAALSLLQAGHKVVLHARSEDRAATLGELASRASGIVLGDLRSAAQTGSIADQVNGIGHMDAVIHNAGIYTEGSRGSSPKVAPASSRSTRWRLTS